MDTSEIQPDTPAEVMEVASPQGGNAVYATLFIPDAAPLPEPFFLSEDGSLCGLTPKGDVYAITSGCPIVATSIMRTYASDSWSLVLKHLDSDSRLHSTVLPMSEVVTGRGSIVTKLADKGLAIVPGMASNLVNYVQHCRPEKRIILAKQVGYLGDRPEVFVLPQAVIGETGGQEVLFQPEMNSPSTASMVASGTLEDWQSNVAEAVKGFPIAMFAIMAALAGPLLKPLRLDGGGFHFFGPSSRGKTTILQVASSVWGKGSDPARDSKSFAQRWLLTSNAVEALAACHNDMLIALDELGTFAGTDLGSVVYMLAGGTGKSAMDSHRRLRQARTWSGNVLSTGEKTIRDAIEEGGRKAKAGQLLRVIDIPAGDIFPNKEAEENEL